MSLDGEGNVLHTTSLKTGAWLNELGFMSFDDILHVQQSFELCLHSAKQKSLHCNLASRQFLALKFAQKMHFA